MMFRGLSRGQFLFLHLSSDSHRVVFWVTALCVGCLVGESHLGYLSPCWMTFHSPSVGLSELCLHCVRDHRRAGISPIRLWEEWGVVDWDGCRPSWLSELWVVDLEDE